MVRADVLAIHGAERPLAEEVVLPQEPGERDVELGGRALRPAVDEEAVRSPADEVVRRRDAGAVADAVEADVEHAEAAAVAERERAVHRVAVECAATVRRREHERAALARRPQP